VTETIDIAGGLRVVHARVTDRGQRREHNEDAVGFYRGPGEPAASCLLIVADGVGGANAGEVASRMAVETTARVYYACGEPEDIPAALAAAMQEANDTIVAAAAADPRLDGMATTCTCAVVRPEGVTLGHVGDCRAYLVHGKTMECLTRDHTLATEYGEDVLAAEERDRLSHVLSRWLGQPGAVATDVRGCTRCPDGGTLVLVSDGLTKVVTDGEIQEAVSAQDPAAACAALLDMANDRGGPDNITVQIAHLGPGPTAAQ
jgi:protein phosphatase